MNLLKLAAEQRPTLINRWRTISRVCLPSISCTMSLVTSSCLSFECITRNNIIGSSHWAIVCFQIYTYAFYLCLYFFLMQVRLQVSAENGTSELLFNHFSQQNYVCISDISIDSVVSERWCAPMGLQCHGGCRNRHFFRLCIFLRKWCWKRPNNWKDIISFKC